MNILFVGNQDNVGYVFCKILVQMNYKPKLLMASNTTHSRSLIKNMDPNYKSEEWIYTYKLNKYDFIRTNPKIKKMAKSADVIVTCGTYINYVLKLNKAIMFIPSGADISSEPFSTRNLFETIRGTLLRKKFNLVTAIMTSQEDSFWASTLLGGRNRTYRTPIPFDMNLSKSSFNQDYFSELNEKYGNYDVILLHTSRKNIKTNRIDYKGSEKVLEAYSLFVKSNPNFTFRMISGNHGNDAKEYQELVKGFKLEAEIDFVPHLDTDKLHALFALKNSILFDQFHAYKSNTIGGSIRQALLYNCIPVCSIKMDTEEFIEGFGPNCPSEYAFSVDEILSVMKKSKQLVEKGIDGENWILKYHHWENKIQKHIDVLKKISNQ